MIEPIILYLMWIAVVWFFVLTIGIDLDTGDKLKVGFGFTFIITFAVIIACVFGI